MFEDVGDEETRAGTTRGDHILEDLETGRTFGRVGGFELFEHEGTAVVDGAAHQHAQSSKDGSTARDGKRLDGGRGTLLLHDTHEGLES